MSAAAAFIRVAIPRGVSEASVSEALAVALRDAAEKATWDSRMLRILESDDALLAYERLDGVPLVRAKVYGATHIDYRYEIPDWYDYRNDPRRPVVMRGCLRALIRKNALSIGSYSANGWCSIVMERYLRYVGWTSFDKIENNLKIDAIWRNLRKKYALRNYDPGRCLDGTVWIRGKKINIYTQEGFDYLHKHWAELSDDKIEEIAHTHGDEPLTEWLPPPTLSTRPSSSQPATTVPIVSSLTSYERMKAARIALEIIETEAKDART